jgi:phosphopantothenoylcysteine decarboxylase/phosphopantothenate--cysteine ligase
MMASLKGKHILLTAGPTVEPIDPVRFLSNRSSGRQGYAIAAACAALGARVTLVSGPVALDPPAGVDRVLVETAREMLDAVEQGLPADVFVAVAAVADWRPADNAALKLKKSEVDGPPVLRLVENPDILAVVSNLPASNRPRLVVGFAAETNDVEAYGLAKIERKKCDWIVANDVSGDVMGGAMNAVSVIRRDGIERWGRATKEDIARQLADSIAVTLNDLPVLHVR